MKQDKYFTTSDVVSSDGVLYTPLTLVTVCMLTSRFY